MKVSLVRYGRCLFKRFAKLKKCYQRQYQSKDHRDDIRDWLGVGKPVGLVYPIEQNRQGNVNKSLSGHIYNE